MNGARTVNELLSIDAERAFWSEQKMLAEVQGGQSGSSFSGVPGTVNPVETQAPPQQVVEPVLQIEVLGIFGLGENLLADVMVAGSRVRFKRGQSYPLGASQGFPYQLVAINTPCVKIVDTAKKEHKACLSK
ncbi:hypothetical protein D3C77_462420 [compost metagenome]